MPLATSLDGTRTFGWGGGAARFEVRTASELASGEPVAYADLEFPLDLKPRSTAYADVIQAVVASLRQVPTPLNARFFSRGNVDLVQDALRQRVSAAMGVDIERQSDWDLLLLMRQTYLKSADNWPEDVVAETDRLNGMVLQEATAVASRNIELRTAYVSTYSFPEAMGTPADALTQPPYAVGTPVPLPDLNRSYREGLGGFLATAPPREVSSEAPWRPTRDPTAGPARDLNDEYDRGVRAFLATAPPADAFFSRAPGT
jgi:hypothetical protein